MSEQEQTLEFRRARLAAELRGWPTTWEPDPDDVEAVLGWLKTLKTLEAERDALQADSLRGSPSYYRLWQEERAKREKAEAALRDCWTVMDASADPRQRELARKMRAALRDTAPVTPETLSTANLLVYAAFAPAEEKP